MDDVDLNLLTALDALLSEGSVSKAALRLGLSPSAMSRTLTRLRAATGDPLLVRAGRGLVPTPRATELRDRIHELARDVRTALSPQAGYLDVASLERTFTIRANEGFVALFSASLAAAVTEAAPHVRLRFAPKPDKDARPLREGHIDLEIGVLGVSAPEVRAQLIFRFCQHSGQDSFWRNLVTYWSLRRAGNC
jgi:DNA-binding transcriptional LysR family regulator